MDVNGKLEVRRVTPEIVRAQEAGQAELARLVPRDPAKVEAAVLAEVKASRDFARRYMYSIPYRNWRDGKEVIDNVEGLSIRAALLCARHMRNLAVGCRIDDETEDAVDLVGFVRDFETNNTFYAPYRVSKWIRLRSGQMKPLAPDRMAQAIQAGASKAIRNAILDVAPEALQQKVFALVRDLAAPPASLKDRSTPHPAVAKRALEEASTIGVSQEMIEAKFGKPLSEFGREDLVRLRGMLTAVEEGHVHAGTMFQADETAESQTEEVEIEPALGARAEELPPREEERARAEAAFEQAFDQDGAPEPDPAEQAAPARASGPRDEKQVVADLLASLDEVKTRDEYEEWPNRNARGIFALSPGARERLLENWKQSGRRRGFSRRSGR